VRVQPGRMHDAPTHPVIDNEMTLKGTAGA